MPTQTTSNRLFSAHSCTRCGGDAFFDRMDDEWRCLQCGREVTFARTVEPAYPAAEAKAA